MADLFSLLPADPFFPTQDWDPLWLCMTQCNCSTQRLGEFSDVPKERGRGSAELAGCSEDCLHAKKGYDLMWGRYSSFYIKHLCPQNRILIFASFYMAREVQLREGAGRNRLKRNSSLAAQLPLRFFLLALCICLNNFYQINTT